MWSGFSAVPVTKRFREEGLNDDESSDVDNDVNTEDSDAVDNDDNNDDKADEVDDNEVVAEAEAEAEAEDDEKMALIIKV